MRREKDIAALREGERTVIQSRASRGPLRDYSLKHTVTMEWNLSEESKIDQIFRLRVDDYEVLLDKEEILRLLRWIN